MLAELHEILYIIVLLNYTLWQNKCIILTLYFIY